MDGMRDTPTRSWRGVSADERQAQRRQQLVDAGLEVIGTQGWANTTVRAVCRAAGLTERYFYQAFDDRDALLIAVYDQVVADGVAVVLQAIGAAPRSFAATVRAVIAAGVDFVTDDPRRGQLLAVESDPRLQRRRQQAMRQQAALIARLGTERFGGRTPDAVDAQLNALAAVGALVEIGTAYLSGGLELSRERLVDHLTLVVLAAAGVSSAG
jgi:AcrR family transcriptional regulator